MKWLVYGSHVLGLEGSIHFKHVLEVFDFLTKAFMTWGRLFDAVDETEILDAVEKALPTYGIRAWSTIAVCDNLGEVANERYFYEALLSFAWKAPPSGKRHARWQSKKRKLVKAGRNIYFLGRPK